MVYSSHNIGFAHEISKRCLVAIHFSILNAFPEVELVHVSSINVLLQSIEVITLASEKLLQCGAQRCCPCSWQACTNEQKRSSLHFVLYYFWMPFCFYCYRSFYVRP